VKPGEEDSIGLKRRKKKEKKEIISFPELSRDSH